MDRIATCLWYKSEAEDAARRYCEVFPASQIDAVHTAPMDWPGGRKGDALLVEFTLLARSMTALNGGEGADHNMAMQRMIKIDHAAIAAAIAGGE